MLRSKMGGERNWGAIQVWGFREFHLILRSFGTRSRNPKHADLAVEDVEV